MEYRGIEYMVLQGVEPGTWKWTVNAVRVQWGEARLRVSAVAAAKRAIDKILTPKKAAPGPAPALIRPFGGARP
jgi:hypothetical protein